MEWPQIDHVLLTRRWITQEAPHPSASIRCIEFHEFVQNISATAREQGKDILCQSAYSYVSQRILNKKHWENKKAFTNWSARTVPRT
jgi:hypothetical protein